MWILNFLLWVKLINYFLSLESFFYVKVFINTQSLQAIEIDLTPAKNAVNKRFASKFCEAKEEGLSSESSSDFALNNTYLKFVTFSDEKKFI